MPKPSAAAAKEVEACPQDQNIERLLRLNVSDKFLLYTTEDGTVVIVSSLCEYVFGTPPLSVVGLNIYDLVRAQDIIALESCMNDGQRYRITHRRVNISMWVEMDDVTPNNWLNMCLSSAQKCAAKYDGDCGDNNPTAIDMEMLEENDNDAEASCRSGPADGSGGRGFVLNRNFQLGNGGPRAPVYHHTPEHGYPVFFPCPGWCRGGNEAVTGCTVCRFSLCVDCSLDFHELLSEQDGSISHNMYLIDSPRSLAVEPVALVG